jgi:hypothetical protein
MFFFGLSILISFIFNISKYNENKYQRLTYKYLVYTKDIVLSTFTYLSETCIGSCIYLYLNILNCAYVEGRTFLFYNFINLMSSKRELNKTNKTIKTRKNRKTIEKKDVFENEDDMMSFLDKIDENKKNI